MTNLDSLIQTAHKLRGPGGCPWDAEQTHESLVQYLLEETYELIDAIEANDAKAIKEELGEEDGDAGDLDVLDERITKANLPREAEEVARKQLKRL